MNDFDAEIKVLNTEIFSLDTIADLSSVITFIVMFIQEQRLR